MGKVKKTENRMDVERSRNAHSAHPSTPLGDRRKTSKIQPEIKTIEAWCH